MRLGMVGSVFFMKYEEWSPAEGQKGRRKSEFGEERYAIVMENGRGLS